MERTLLSTLKGGNGETVEVFHVEEFGGVSSDGAGLFLAENERGVRRNGAGVRQKRVIFVELRTGHAMHSTREGHKTAGTSRTRP